VAKIVLPLRGEEPPGPPYGGLGEEGWARGVTFYELVERAGEHRAGLEAAFRDCRVPPELAASVGRYPKRVRVLALAGVADRVSRLVVARAERLFTLSSHIWMRVFDPATCGDLVERYAPRGQDLPVLAFFGENQKEFARWSQTAGAPAPSDAPGMDDPAPFLRSLHRLLEAHAAPAP
jgi:hypothetical protein